mmetsp:Transcript_68244/g.120741  ORF Transcript_68244/g.120741 Transcript_68244/m.120741 type:complete len:263 (+) Transcript_68244:743-1531(+)
MSGSSASNCPRRRTVLRQPSLMVSLAFANSISPRPPRRGLMTTSAGSPAIRARVMRSCMMSIARTPTSNIEWGNCSFSGTCPSLPSINFFPLPNASLIENGSFEAHSHVSSFVSPHGLGRRVLGCAPALGRCCTPCSCSLLVFLLFWVRVEISPVFRLTAITTSAPRARQVDTGTGFTRAPSCSHWPSILMGEMAMGTAIDARTADSSGPCRIHTSRPDSMSVATAANLTFMSSMLRFPMNCSMMSSRKFSPRMRPPSFDRL